MVSLSMCGGNMSIIAENIKTVENGELKPIATLYTAYNLLISTGIESTDFFYTEEEAVFYGTCKMGSFKVSKLECFIATRPKTGEYKIIKETVCCSIPKPSQEDEEIPPEIKFWCPEEAGFKIYKNGKWSSEYINKLARSHKNGIVANLAIFHAFFQSGVNLLNDSNDMVYVVDGRVFCYSHRLRQDIYKDFFM